MRVNINWDKLGITASVACAIHCVVLPLIITSLPILGINLIHNTLFEYSMIILSLLVGCFALMKGYRQSHRNIFPVTFFIAGMLLLFAKQYWHQFEIVLVPLSVLLIVSAHSLNLRLCHLVK